MPKIIISLICCFLATYGFGQVEFHLTEKERKEKKLTEYSNALHNQGFQNIAVIEEKRTLHVTFENRRFRNEIDALKKAIDIFYEQVGLNYQAIEYTLQNRGIPTLTSNFAKLKKEDRESASVISLQLLSSQIADTKDWYERFGNRLKNKGQWSLEFEVAPQLFLALGSARDPILHQLNLLPTANLYLWKGARIKMQGIVPISDELKNPEDKFWRPRLMTFSQYIQLPKQFIVSGTLGYFTSRRYGGALEVNKFLGKNSKLLAQGGVGLTGFASFPKTVNVDTPIKGWQIGDLNYWTYYLAAEYIIPRWSLRTRLEWRKVLLNRSLVRAEVWRQFNELQLGFFLFRFDGQENYGFQLAFPLFPKRYAKPGRIHFKTSRFIDYTYHTTQYYASDFSTGENLWQFFETLHPAFMNTRFFNK